MALIRNSLPVKGKVTVAKHPSANKYFCGLNPNRYNIQAHASGIYEDLYFDLMRQGSQYTNRPWMSKFCKSKGQIPLGQGYRHTEVGGAFPEEYIPINEADKPLGPKSGWAVNVITETDLTIEKMHIRTSHNHDTFAPYYKDYSSFKQLLNILKGNLSGGLEDARFLITIAPLLSDPTSVVWSDEEIARIFESYGPMVPEENMPEQSKLDAINRAYVKKLFTKYYLKGQKLWPNVIWYNTYSYSTSNKYEESRKDDLYEAVVVGKDKDKRQKQKLYTDAHEGEEARGDDDGQVTRRIDNLTRNESLLALFYALRRSVRKATGQKSTRMWLGYNAGLEVYQTKAAQERARLEGLGVEGVNPEQNPDYENPNTTASANHGFRVQCNPEDLVIFMNPDDYYDLMDGVSRTGDDNKSVNLSGIGCPNIYPLEFIKAGYARVIDYRAWAVNDVFQLSDVQAPAEELTWRYKLHMHFETIMFQNFAGWLLVPTPHFVASPDLYDAYSLIGQEIEKKK